MAVSDLFSHRRRVANGGTPDVFVYDELSKEIRVQIIHIWRDAIGRYYVSSSFGISPPHNNSGWEEIHNTVAREHGVLDLGNGPHINRRCETYLLGVSVDHALDLIDASFQYIDTVMRGFEYYIREERSITVTADNAIEELNERFRRAGVGYRFDEGMLFRVDTELVHSEVVLPALRYLHQQGFEGPREEFMKAYGHYRAGEMKDAITNANNAFESTLKAICDQRRWEYQKGARASDLLKIVRRNGLLPSYLDASFDQLSATLTSGLPKVRNEEGGHGQGAEPRKTPDYVAAYALHLAAAKILFLAEAHKNTDST